MITTSPKTSYSYLRRVLALPLILFVVSLFSFTFLQAQSGMPPSRDTLKKGMKRDTFRTMYEEKLAKEQDELNGRSMNAKLRDELFSLRKTEHDSEGSERARKLTEAILNDPPDIIYYVNGTQRSAPYIKNLKIDEVSTINVYTGDTAVRKYGKNAMGGVVEFTTKN